MRINGTPPLRTTAARRDDRAGGSSDRAFSSAIANDGSAAPTSAMSALGAVDGLFALQEVADALTGRRRAGARGKALLDQLDELRLALLSGALPRERLHALARLAREQSPLQDDPQLAEVLAELELRVAVELAKIGEAV